MATVLQRVIRQLRRQAVREQSGSLADGELLRQFVRGKDELAFEVLVERHR